MYNFDEIIDRRNTNAVKFERCKALFGTDDILPLWVADMDFRTPDFILNAIKERLEHPILGYTLPSTELFEAMQKWISEHHNWPLEREWLGFQPGIVPGLSLAVQSLTAIGDEIIVQPPVYYPFFNVIRNNHRTIVNNPLKEENGRFVMDYDNLESVITDKTKMLILCNPHNPGGRVWTKDELGKLADICEKHDITVISDEIHADMVLPGATAHCPFATVTDWAKNHSITFMAPTKVFNMPGLISSSYIIPNTDLRKKYITHVEATEMYAGNIFAYTGALATYQHGEQWRVEMLEYVQKNIDFVADFLKKEIPAIVPMIPEASFLIWLDFKNLGMETDELHRFVSLKAKLGLNKGTTFGQGGEYHLRLNVATPRAILEKALLQLKNAIEQR